MFDAFNAQPKNIGELLSDTLPAKIARWLLVFVTRYSIIVRLDSSGMETVFFKLARNVRSKMTDPKNAKTTLNEIKKTLSDNAPTNGQVKEAVKTLVLDPEEAV